MRLPTLTPERYSRVAFWALFMLMGIVMTGAGVRLSGSGLGCPDWPQCYGGIAPPLKTHAIIEYGNRVISGFVGITAAAAGLLAFRRRPYRRDLAAIGLLLPLGVGQAVLGGFTVRNHLAPGFVMSHYILSMLLLAAAVTLLWRSRHEPGSRPRSTDRLTVWGVRVLVPLGAAAIFLGTAATASGPHAGGAGTGDVIDRLDWRGSDTLSWVVHRHASIAAALGVVAVALWLLVRLRGTQPRTLRSLTLLCCLIATQGALGVIQYNLELPSEIVWVHVSLAAFIWVSILFAAAAAGRLQPRAVRARAMAEVGAA